MTNLAVDSFGRPDQSGFGTASDGQAWVRDAGIGVSNIVSDQGRVGPGGNDSFFLIGTGTAGTVNCLCRVKSGDATNVVAVLFRYSSTSGTNVSGYRAGFFGSNLVVDRYVNGVRSNIGSTNVGYTVGQEWRVRAIANGTTITVTGWQDGNTEPGPQLNLTDSSVSTGQYGVSAFMMNDFTYFDQLLITDNQAPPPPGVQGSIEATWMTRSNAITWVTRNGQATWKTRDNNVIWITRKE